MPVSQVARVPHQTVVVGDGKDRRNDVPTLAGEKVPVPSLQIEIGLAKPKNLARLAAAVLKIDLDEAADAGGFVQLNGFEPGAQPGQTRVHGQIAIRFGAGRFRLYPEAELVALHLRIVEHGVEADKSVNREFSGIGRIPPAQQAGQYCCGDSPFQKSAPLQKSTQVRQNVGDESSQCSVPEISYLNSAVESPGSQGARAQATWPGRRAMATLQDGMNRRKNGEVFMGQDTNRRHFQHRAPAGSILQRIFRTVAVLCADAFHV